MSDIITRLDDEADLCRQEGAHDIANLLREAALEARKQAFEIERLWALLRDARYLVASIDSAYARNTVARIDDALAEQREGPA